MPTVGDLFKPVDTEAVKRSQIDRFRQFINTRYGLDIKDPWELHSWSVDQSNEFWKSVWDFYRFIGERGAEPFFQADVSMKATRNSLPHARLNYAENLLLSHCNARSTSKIAIHSVIEGTVIRSLTWAELYDEVRSASRAMRNLGLCPGDRVAAYTANNAEAVVLILAASAIGAIWSATPCEFGVIATLDRLEQINPKLLLVSDRYIYNGRLIDVSSNVTQIVQALASNGLESVIVVGQLEKDRRPNRLPGFGCVKAFDWPSFLDFDKSSTGDIDFWRGPAMAPVYILYSSGTTGKPKCIVHHAGGLLLSHAVGQCLHSDLGPNDAFLMFTTFGWMMSVFYVASLQSGATVVAFDGSPLKPIGALWALVDQLKLTILGISPRYIQTLCQAGYNPSDKHHLESLRLVLTTGAPLSIEHHDFIKQRVGEKVFLFNGSGGTDVCNHHICGCLALPHHYGELQMPMLGSKIECWNDDGKPLSAGVEGNLVLTGPIPNQPLYFWNDPGDKRYFSTYYESFPDKEAWNQGDWVVVGPNTRGFHMLGRSDGVLNPSGVRFGSAELYAIVDSFSEITNSLAVGQKTATGDERVILFLETDRKTPLRQSTINNITEAIARGLSRRHVPALILQCPEIPMTSNGKRQEIAVKKILSGARLEQVNADPKTLLWFMEHPALKVTAAPLKAKL